MRRYRREEEPWASVAAQPDGSLLYRSSYNADLVEALKSAIPPAGRKWDGERKAWLVDPRYAQELAHLTSRHLGVDLELPVMTCQANQMATEELEIRYLGSTKPKTGAGEPQAMGWCAEEWSVVFPESVLRKFFVDVQPGMASTLYGVLGLARDADLQEIKGAYRRLALQWHPDHCQEEGAGEQFQKIKRAYEVLSDGQTRAKYNAGLALSLQISNGRGSADSGNLDGKWGYRAPLRCGLVKVKARRVLGRTVVAEILSWDDITNPQGQTLIVSWPRGAKKFAEVWI